MNDQTDSQLLRDYAERHSEAAFTELVRRHVDFVYSAALRMVCDSHFAEDVTQGVFVALAKSASQLVNRPVLSGWLHRTAQNIAAQTVRTIERRRAREQEAAAMNEFHEPDALWEHIALHLDAALGELSDSDRDALLLRYFEGKSAREIAQTLGVSDDAAQKRVSRAVERLREFFAKRGVTVGASGLVVVISANAVQAAPVGLAVTISTAAALAGTSLATTATATATKAIVMTTFQKALVTAAIVAGAGTTLVIQHQARVGLREENQSLRQQIAQLQTDNESLSSRATPAGSSTLKLPAPRVRASIAPTQAPADELQVTNLSARLKDYSARLTAAQVESYLSAHRRSAASLLAAYRTTGDPALLEEAKQSHPDDPQVAFEAAFRKDAPPEERRQWLNAFKQSAPENALPNYLSALDYFKAGQADQAVQELIAASGKQQFHDYTSDRLQDDEEAYLAAGHPVAEAKTIPAQQLLLPQLAQFKELSQHMMELSKSYQQAGDQASAQAALQMAAQLGQRYGSTVPGEPTISQLVGFAVERIALNAMDPASSYGDGQTVKDRLDQLAKQRAEVEERARQMDALQSLMTDRDWITYKDRWRVFGEDAAAKWLIGKYGQQ